MPERTTTSYPAVCLGWVPPREDLTISLGLSWAGSETLSGAPEGILSGMNCASQTQRDRQIPVGTLLTVQGSPLWDQVSQGRCQMTGWSCGGAHSLKRAERSLSLVAARPTGLCPSSRATSSVTLDQQVSALNNCDHVLL